MRKSLSALVGLIAVVSICGCGVASHGDQSVVAAAAVTTSTTPSPAAVRLARATPGVVSIDGRTSGSLTPLAAAAYRASGGISTVSITHERVATAFAKLCQGQIEMVDSASPISLAELAQCKRAGIRPVQLQVASDAIVFATKTADDVGADCLSVAQVKTLFRAGSPVFNWGQLGFDELPVAVAGPRPGDAAFTLFSQQVLGTHQQSLLNLRSGYVAEPSWGAVRQFVAGSDADVRAAARVTRLRQQVRTLNAILAGTRATLTGANRAVTDTAFQVTKGIEDGRPLVTQEQDQTNLIQAQAKQKKARADLATQTAERAARQRSITAGLAARRHLAGEVGRLGVFQFSAYTAYAEATQSLRPLEITAAASPENCIFPSAQTIASGAYPLSRQLLITTSVQAAQRSDVRSFLLSYLHNSQRLAISRGLTALPDDALAREEMFLGGGAQPITTAVGGDGTGSAPVARLPKTVH